MCDSRTVCLCSTLLPLPAGISGVTTVFFSSHIHAVAFMTRFHDTLFHSGTSQEVPMFRWTMTKWWVVTKRRQARPQIQVLLPTFHSLSTKQMHEAKYGIVVESQSNPTDTTKPVCKRYFKPTQTKRANKSVQLGKASRWQTCRSVQIILRATSERMW